MTAHPVLVWYRSDLRLSDNPAIVKAVETRFPIIPVYIFGALEKTEWAMGAASRWWLHHSLEALNASLGKKKSRLIFRRGSYADEMEKLIKQTGAVGVYANRLYEPAELKIEEAVRSRLKKHKILFHVFNGNYLFDPRTILTQQQNPYQVFTPYWKSCLNRPPPRAEWRSPKKWSSPKKWPSSENHASWKLLPKIKWDAKMAKAWTPGEDGAQKACQRFCRSALKDYQIGRNRPDQKNTSRLSPHLHFGEISPRQVWLAVDKKKKNNKLGDEAKSYQREIGWREFAIHLLTHFPHTTNQPLRTKYENFPWKKDAKTLTAWQKGQTGYPIVDAGMRELWSIGWMHNRVRMIVSSFLVKDLLIKWQEGAAWFWDTLVDADLGNNSLGWQWSAGCGADAAPYFRIFNPITQGGKFDPEGKYIRHWLPELKNLPTKFIHQPWNAPKDILKKAKIHLGEDYPFPIVDHGEARTKALAAFHKLKKSSPGEILNKRP